MAIQQSASGVFARAQSLVDRAVSPETRSQFYSNTNTFAHEQPILFVSSSFLNRSPALIPQQTFLAIQLALSSTPLLLFLSFVTALLFSLFWIGVALLLLLPTLFVTVSLGIVVWIWAVSSFLVARWVYDVVPVNVRGKAEVGLPNGKKIVVDKQDGWRGEGKVEGKVVDGV
jgi:membrane protein implicated in regulation of membrane protease activity